MASHAELIAQLREQNHGENPCRSLVFEDDAGKRFGQICDSPRCPDCGPRKFDKLWSGITQNFGGQAYLYQFHSEADYKRFRGKMRKQASRRGESPTFVHWVWNGQFEILSDFKVTGTSRVRVMVDSIKARVRSAYAQVKRGLSWSQHFWHLVTLSRISITSGVTGRLRYRRRISLREQMEAIEEAARLQQIRAVGLDPDEWDVWEQHGTLASTITAGKRRTRR